MECVIVRQAGRAVTVRQILMNVIMLLSVRTTLNVIILMSCEFEPRSLQGVLNTTFVIKFVSDLRQVGGFLRVLFINPSSTNCVSRGLL
jgi:hypothetical protein